MNAVKWSKMRTDSHALDVLQIKVVPKPEKKLTQSILEFLNRLTHFGAEEGSGKRDGALGKLVSPMKSNQALQASALVGRQVWVCHENIVLTKDGDVPIAIEVPPGVTDLVACIYSASNTLINAWKLTPGKSGFFQFVWNGSGVADARTMPGVYKIKVYGMQHNEKQYVKTMRKANVDSVSLRNGGKDLKLHVAGIGMISLDALIFGPSDG